MRKDPFSSSIIIDEPNYTSGTITVNGTLVTYSNQLPFSGTFSVVVGNNATLGFIAGGLQATNTQVLTLGSGDSLYESGGNSNITNVFNIQSGGTLSLTNQSAPNTLIGGLSPFYIAQIDGSSVFESGAILSADINLEEGLGQAPDFYGYPVLQVNGNLALGLGTILDLNVSSDGPSAIDTFAPFITYSGTLSGNFVSNGVAIQNDTPFTLNGDTVEIDYGTGTNSAISVEILSVPEPSTCALTVCGLSLVLMITLRNRFSKA